MISTLSADFTGTDDIRRFLQGLSEEEYCDKFGKELQHYNEILKDESQIMKIDNPVAIISYLMKMEITDEGITRTQYCR